MNKPKISVIIPVYNGMKYLPETVESVFQQTLTDFELLIINDGSTDNIVEWVAELSDHRVRLISQSNQGTAIARNHGITEAKGEYIALLDADDLWESTKLEKQAECLDHNPLVGLVDTWAITIDDRGNASRIRKHEVEGNVYHKVYEACDNPVCCGSSPMIRRSCFDVIGLFDPNIKIVEDVDMWIRIASRYHFGLIKEVLVKYRLHPQNKSKDCQSMLPEFRVLIEKTYRSLPVESLYLRAQCYAKLNLFLAWRMMENQDYRQAAHFHRQAIAHHFDFLFKPESIRLAIAIFLVRLFGFNIFQQIRAFNRSIRHLRTFANG
jgi:glycosyltransferase involved in cell wall biosynthesis